MILPAPNQAVEDIRDVIDAADAQLIAELGRVDASTSIELVKDTIASATSAHVAELRALGLPVLETVTTEDSRDVSVEQYLYEIVLAQFTNFLEVIKDGEFADNEPQADEQRAAGFLVRRNWLAGPLMAPYKHVANLDPGQDDRVGRQRTYRDSVIQDEGLENRGDALRAVFLRIGSLDADRYQAQFFAANSQDLELPEVASLGLETALGLN